MSSLLGDNFHSNGSTMPSRVYPMGRMHLPHPRPTVSLDPRPVVIPILSSVIGFPILVFALICALRHRAIKLRRKDQLRKLQGGSRNATLDIPTRERMSYFSGGSSPEVSTREAGDRMDSVFPGPNSAGLKSSLQTARRSQISSKTNNHVTFVTPPTTLDVSTTMQVDVVLHTIAASAAECIGVVEINGIPWKTEGSPIRTIEDGVQIELPESPR